jgi:hypothetical protein
MRTDLNCRGCCTPTADTNRCSTPASHVTTRHGITVMLASESTACGVPHGLLTSTTASTTYYVIKRCMLCNCSAALVRALENARFQILAKGNVCDMRTLYTTATSKSKRW